MATVAHADLAPVHVQCFYLLASQLHQRRIAEFVLTTADFFLLHRTLFSSQTQKNQFQDGSHASTALTWTGGQPQENEIHKAWCKDVDHVMITSFIQSQ